MLSLEQVADLYPYANTLEKAIGFISCAAKQGRTEVRIRAAPEVRARLCEFGYGRKTLKYLLNGDIEFTVYWNF